MSKKDPRIDLIKELEKELKYSRFIHTLGVAFTATSLAERYGADMHKAEMAGLLHDCAKYIGPERMEALCRKEGLPVSATEQGNGALLHAKAGSVLARSKYGVEDEEVLSAIRCHTTGKPEMTLLEKILFLADYIEPGRDEAPNLQEIRALAFEDIDAAVIKVLRDTLDFLQASGREIDPMTQKTYDYYITKAD